MRLFAFIIFVTVMLLATCSAPNAVPTQMQTDVPALPANTEPSPALPGTCTRGRCAPGDLPSKSSVGTFCVKPIASDH